MLAFCRGKRSPGGRAGKGPARAALAVLAVSAAALGMAGLSPVPAAHAAPAAPARATGTALAWGDNNYRQLGDGSTANSSGPARVHLPAGTLVTAVSAGYFHSLAVTSDGRVLAWGANYLGQLGDGSTTGSSGPGWVHLPARTRVTAVSAGGYHSLAVTSDGRVLAWGWNAAGQLGDGSTTNKSGPGWVHLPAGTRVTAVAAGGYHSLA